MRPNGAYKLLTTLVWGKGSGLFSKEKLDSHPTCTYRVNISSVRNMARFLGSQSYQLRDWVGFLEDAGIIQDVLFTRNGKGRMVSFLIRTPENQENKG